MFKDVWDNSPSLPSQEAPPSKLMGGGGASIRVKGSSVACAKHRRRHKVVGRGTEGAGHVSDAQATAAERDYSVPVELRFLE